jgi:histidinol-phosphatase (PHP family)
MKITADMHVHSTFSIDAEDDMDALCRAALNRGLTCLCFTDHYDLLEEDISFNYLDLDQYCRSLEELQARYRGRLTVLKGLEFGEPHLFPREFADVSARGFDMIMAGIHSFDSQFIGDRTLLDRFSREEVFQGYYQEVLKLVEFGGFDVLAHLDLPKRYFGVPEQQNALLDRILAVTAQQGIALEINTSPLRKGLSECSPDYDVLVRFKHWGGERLTVGSDAHRSRDLGGGFAHAADLLGRAGFEGAGYFLNRQFRLEG